MHMVLAVQILDEGSSGHVCHGRMRELSNSSKDNVFSVSLKDDCKSLSYFFGILKASIGVILGVTSKLEHMH